MSTSLPACHAREGRMPLSDLRSATHAPPTAGLETTFPAGALQAPTQDALHALAATQAST